MRTIHTAGLVLIALSLLLLACGDDDDAAPTSTVPSTVTTEPPAPSTEATPPSTVSPTTPEAPSTTIDEVAATEAAVAAAAVQSRENYLYAVRNYDAADALEVLGRTTASNSPAMQLALDNMEALRSNGWRTRENPDVPSTLTVESDVELLDGPPATRAEVTVCEIGAGIVYEPGAAPDGSDTLVNDEIVARRARTTLVLEDGAWKVFGGESLGEWNGAATCPAA